MVLSSTTESNGSSGSGSEGSSGGSGGSSDDSSDSDETGYGGLGFGITGNVILGDETAGNIISGSVRKGSDFSYDLNGQSASIETGSVKYDGQGIGDNQVDLEIENGNAVVSTDYSVVKDEIVVDIDLSTLNFIAENGILSADLTSENGSESVLEKEIVVSNVSEGLNETIINEPLVNETIINETITNETIELNQTILNETLVNETITNETLVNATSLIFIGNIPSIRIQVNESYELNLNEYFENAERYEFVSTNISYNISGNVLTLTPDVDFKGSKKGRVIAYSGNESLESNQFNILVGGIKVDLNHENITLGEPVKWTAEVSLESRESAVVNLPKEADNVTVNDVAVESVNGELVANSGITGNVIGGVDSSGNGLLSRLLSFFNGFGITGNVVSDENVSDNDSILDNESLVISENISEIIQSSVQEIDIGSGNESIELVLNNSQNYTIEYYTDAPIAIEESTSYGKKVRISGPELNYTNVLSFTNVSELVDVGMEGKIKVYWEENGSYIQFDAYDLDGNGKIDYIEWITPHLSNQTFDIILITKAEHLDSNRTIIEDVYDYVRSLDNITTSIPSGDYLRVRFERVLDKNKDITLFVNSNLTGENASVRVKVYEKDGNVEIADFGTIGEFGKYRIMLNNLNGTQDSFDLLVYGTENSSVIFDYVVDPVNAPIQPVLNSPGNRSAGVLSPYVLNVTVSDPDADLMNVTFQDRSMKVFANDHTCGIISNGSAMCWGLGSFGALGDGLSTSSSNSVYVNTTNTFKSISAGLTASCGIITNGSVMCWGQNIAGMIGDGTTTNRANPVFVNTTTNVFVDLMASYKYTCGIILNGSVMCWGIGTSAQLGNGGTSSSSSAVYVNTAYAFTSIAAGGLVSCGIITNGSAMCWGAGTYGSIGDGTTNQRTSPVFVNTTKTFTHLSAAYFHTCGIISNGSAMCWGSNAGGRLGDGTTTNSNNPVYVNTSNAFVRIAAGQTSTCGILANGSAMCWGAGSNGQLGNGLGVASSNPVYVNTSNAFVDLSCDQADGNSCCGIISNGSAMCWGLNTNGRLGDGTTTQRNNPVYVNTSNAFESTIIGTVNNVASGGSASLSWSTLSYLTTYLWSVMVSDSSLVANSPIWLFTTQSTPPGITIQTPTETDGNTYTRTNIQVNISMIDANPGNITINLYNSTGLVNSSVSANAALNYFVNFTSLSEGIYYFNATAINTGGITNSTATRNISIDNSVPSISVTSPVNIIYNSTTITVNFTSSDALSPISARWFFNGTGNTTYTGVTSQTVGQGSNTFIFYSNDSLGNSASVSVTFSVDTVSPQIGVTYPVNSTYNYVVNTLNYSYSDTNIGSCWYSLNGGANNNSAPSCNNITGLTSNQGSNTWIVYGNDTAGNTNSSAITFFVDSISPGVNFISPTEVNNGIYSRNNIGINVTMDDTNPSNITIRLYNVTGLMNTSVSVAGALSYFINFTGLSEGIYYFNATAVDGLSNINDSETRTVTIDLSPPSFTITNPLNQTYNTNEITINFTSADLNGISSRWFYNGTGNTTYTGVTSQTAAEGSNIFMFYTNDTAGNTNSTSKTFLVDTTLPLVGMVYPTNTSYNSVITALNYTYSDSNLGSCWFFNGTGNTTTNCALNVTAGLLSSQGSNTWIVYSNDSANNVNSSSITFFLDSIIPGINFTSPSEINGSYLNRNSLAVNVTMDDSNPSNVTIRLYNSTGLRYENVSSNGAVSYFVNYTSLTDGIYYFNATVVDTLGNQNNSESRRVIVDRLVPAITITSPTNSTYNTNNITINFTSSDALSSIDKRWFYNGTGNTTYTDVVTQTAAEGSNIFMFYTNDTAGNTNSSTKTFLVDTTYPLVRMVYPANTSYNSVITALNYTYSDSNFGSCWFFNGTGNNSISCGTNATISLSSSQGTNTWIVYGNDTSGNANSSTKTFFVDSIIPGVNFASPSENNGSYLSRNNIQINISMTDANPGNITIRLYNATGLMYTNVSSNGVLSYPVNYTSLADGNYTFNATATDVLNNQNNTETRRLVVDTTYPGISYGQLTEENNSNLFRSNVVVNVTVSDINPVNLSVRLFGPTGLLQETNSSGSVFVNFTGLDDETYYFNATVTDLAGNVNNTETRRVNVVLDYVNPSIYFVSTSDSTGYKNRNNIFVNVSVSDKHLANSTISLFNSSSVVNETLILVNGSYALNYTSLADGVYFVNASAVDLSLNRNRTETRNITLDTTNPLINYGSGVEAIEANVSRNWIFANVSVVEINEANITFNLYNSTGIVNSSMFSNGQRVINWTNLNQGVYYYNVTIIDSVNRVNSTETRQILLDTGAPTISYFNSTSVLQNSSVNMTLAASDALSGLGSAVFELSYPNGSVLNYTPSISAGVYNLTMNLSILGDYAVKGYVNDSAGNIANSSVGFEVYLPIVILGNVTDASGMLRNYTFEFYSPETGELKYNLTGNNYSSSELHNRAYDVIIKTDTDHQITLYNLTMNQSIIPIQIDNFSSETNPEGVSSHKVLVGLGVNSTFTGSGVLNISYDGLFDPLFAAVNEAGLEVYKCSNYTFSSRTCSEDYVLYPNYTIDTTNDRAIINVSGFSSYIVSEGTCGNSICNVPYGETIATCPGDCIPNSEPAPSGGSDGGGGGGGGSVISTPSSAGIQFNILKIERQVPVGDSIIENLNIDNTLSTDMTVNIIVSDSLRSLILVKQSEIVPARGSKSVPITIVGTTQGVYNGQISLITDAKNYTIPVTILVSGKSDRLLDLNVVLGQKTVSAGEDLDFTISAFNLGKLQRYDIFLDYSIQKKDDNRTIVSNSESFAIETSLSLARKLNVPSSIENGDYMIVLKASYGEDQTAIASANFRVGKDSSMANNNSLSTYLSILSAVALLIVLIGGSIYYFVTIRKKLFEKKMEEIKKNSIYVFPDFKLLPHSKFAYIGLVADTDVKTYLDYTQLNRHTLIAGGTGSGKTVAGMVVVEELIKRGTNVIVLDPVGQWTGFANRNTDKIMSQKYHKFGLSSAKGFPISVIPISKETMNLDISAYMDRKGLVVLNMNKLSPKDIDLFVEQCLRRIYTSNMPETSSLKSVIVLDEVHRILPKYGGKKAYVRLEQAVREFRKWGIGLLMISQVLTDFKGAIRGNIGTEIQLQTRYEGDIKRVRERSGSKISRLVSKMPVGLGIVECPSYNHGAPYFVEFRPLLHSPFKLTDAEIAKYAKKEKPVLQKVENLNKAVPSSGSASADSSEKKEEKKPEHYSSHSSAHHHKK